MDYYEQGVDADALSDPDLLVAKDHKSKVRLLVGRMARVLVRDDYAHVYLSGTPLYR